MQLVHIRYGRDSLVSLACPALVASSFRLLFPPSLMPDQPNSNRGLGAFLFFIYLSVNLGALLLAAQSQRQPRSYLNSTAVTLSEILKLLTSIAAIRASAPSARAALATVVRVVFRMPDQMLRVAMPALLYTIQNNIIYAALSHVDAVTFQITYQLKIVASLLASRILLKKKASVMRWISTLLLTFGVILVQLSLNQAEESADAPAPAAAATAAAASAGSSTSGGGSSSGAAGSSASTGSGGGDADAEKPKRNRPLGVAMVLAACLCSGLAGAVMELLLKGSTLPLPERNLQVATISLVLASVHMLTNDSAALRARGFFQGYNPAVWAMVSLDSVGGILVSMLLKYTTAMLKNFAAPIGIILNCLLSRYVLQSSSFKPNKFFLLGTTFVLLALGLFSASA